MNTSFFRPAEIGVNVAAIIACANPALAMTPGVTDPNNLAFGFLARNVAYNRPAVADPISSIFYTLSTNNSSATYTIRRPTVRSVTPACFVGANDREATEVAQTSRILDFNATPISKVLNSETSQSPLASDAKSFIKALAGINWRPSIWSDTGEVVFEWIAGKKHAIVSVEGDGLLGYTMLHGDNFVSGKNLEASVDSIPEDLLEYLEEA